MYDYKFNILDLLNNYGRIYNDGDKIVIEVNEDYTRNNFYYCNECQLLRE
jgi:hypothetical protein